MSTTRPSTTRSARHSNGSRVFASALASMGRPFTPTKSSRNDALASPEAQLLGAAPAAAAAAEPRSKPRDFVTRWPASWQMEPSVDSKRLRVLPSGIQVKELRIDCPIAGWVSIEPHGFVKLDDVVVVQDAVSGSCPLSTPRARRNSTGSVATPQVSRDAVVAINMDLRNLREERDALAREVAQLKRARQIEDAGLEVYRSEKTDLAQKLARCRDAVAHTFGFLERIHGTEECEDEPGAAEACAEHANLRSPAGSPTSGKENEHAKLRLPVFSPASGKENASAKLRSPAFSPASGKENSIAFSPLFSPVDRNGTPVGKSPNAALKEKQPRRTLEALSSCNVRLF